MLREENLHDYQKRGVEMIKTVDNCALFLDMGLGKTVISLTAINYLINDDFAIANALVVAPKRVVENVWKNETRKWEHLKALTVTEIVGNPKQRLRKLRDGQAKKSDVFVISRDNLGWLILLYGGGMLPFDMLIIDELSGYKDHASQRFKYLRPVLGSFKKIVGLTGTPTPNGVVNLWSQMYILDRGQRLGKNITTFRRNFCTMDYRSQGHAYLCDNPIMQSKIYELIGDITISMKAEDYLDMPELIMNQVEVRFDDKLRKEYDKFKEDAILELLDNVDDPLNIPAPTAGVLINKLLQFSNGAIYDLERNVHVIHNLKLDALAEIIDDADGKPILLAYEYEHDRDRILERFKSIKPRLLKKPKDMADWNEGKIRLALTHPASAGHGLNLQEGGNIIVWFGLTWSLELYQQFNARLYRQGQKSNSVIVNHIINPETADARVWEVLQKKDGVQESVMDAVKAIVADYL